MKKKNNISRKSLLIASLLAVASIGVGTAGTVAFFQSNHSFDVTIQAATVDVEQGVPAIVKKSLAYESEGADVTADKGTVNANLVVPGDTFLIKVGYTNKSTIAVKYRIGVTASKGLKAEVFTDEACTTTAKDTSYTDLAKNGTIADHYVKVTVTDDLENGGTGKVTIGVDAIQSNVPSDGIRQDDAKKTIEIYSTEGLLKLQNTLSTISDSEYNRLAGYTVNLKADIDLSSVENWRGLITNTSRSFNLNFDGEGHTISNLKIKDGTGFINYFGFTTISSDIKTDSKGNRYQAHGNYTFKNVVFDKANVVNNTINSGNLGAGNCAGVVTGTALGLDMEGVTVKDSYVEALKYVGGLAGYLTGVVESSANPNYSYQFQHVIKDCHVENTKIYARKYRAGGFVGYANPYSGEGYLRISGSSVSGCTLKADVQAEGDRGWMVATSYNGIEGSNLSVNGTAITKGDQAVDEINVFNPLNGNTANIQDPVIDASTFSTNLTAGGYIDLGDDVSLTLDNIPKIEKDTVIDLNGRTLSLDAESTDTALSVENGSTLTLKNGSVKGTGKGGNIPLIQTKTGNIVLDNVNYTAKDGNALQYEGSGSNVTIKDSTITVDGGYYGIATNANGALGDQSKSKVNITGSTISVTRTDHDNAAIFFNVGGKYSISNSTISGQRQGIMVRSGDLTLNNVTIDKTEDFPKETVDAGKFGSGNEVPQAALFLGNNVNAGYEKPSKVTFAGPVTFKGVGPAIVASGSTTQNVDLETGTYYHGDVKVYDFREKDDKHTFKINKKDIEIGKYTHDGTSVYKIA